ncbi:hypothetical protein WJX73_004304 [Symbiochloris irregularis]|uniref:Uncharacterized protein n=1 Tax=Symbiochloris irregularis TaxID=706552 RepID=A0AAW1NWB4_9CHLO
MSTCTPHHSPSGHAACWSGAEEQKADSLVYGLASKPYTPLPAAPTAPKAPGSRRTAEKEAAKREMAGAKASQRAAAQPIVPAPSFAAAQTSSAERPAKAQSTRDASAGSVSAASSSTGQLPATETIQPSSWVNELAGEQECRRYNITLTVEPSRASAPIACNSNGPQRRFCPQSQASPKLAMAESSIVTMAQRAPFTMAQGPFFCMAQRNAMRGSRQGLERGQLALQSLGMTMTGRDIFMDVGGGSGGGRGPRGSGGGRGPSGRGGGPPRDEDDFPSTGLLVGILLLMVASLAALLSRWSTQHGSVGPAPRAAARKDVTVLRAPALSHARQPRHAGRIYYITGHPQHQHRLKDVLKQRAVLPAVIRKTFAARHWKVQLVVLKASLERTGHLGERCSMQGGMQAQMHPLHRQLLAEHLQISIPVTQLRSVVAFGTAYKPHAKSHSAEGEGHLSAGPSRQGSAASVLSEDSEARLPRQRSTVAFGTTYTPHTQTHSAEGEASFSTVPIRQGSAASVMSEDSEAKLPRQPSRVAFGSSYKPRAKTASASSTDVKAKSGSMFSRAWKALKPASKTSDSPAPAKTSLAAAGRTSAPGTSTSATRSTSPAKPAFTPRPQAPTASPAAHLTAAAASSAASSPAASPRPGLTRQSAKVLDIPRNTPGKAQTATASAAPVEKSEPSRSLGTLFSSTAAKGLNPAAQKPSTRGSTGTRGAVVPAAQKPPGRSSTGARGAVSPRTMIPQPKKAGVSARATDSAESSSSRTSTSGGWSPSGRASARGSSTGTKPAAKPAGAQQRTRTTAELRGPSGRLSRQISQAQAGAWSPRTSLTGGDGSHVRKTINSFEELSRANSAGSSRAAAAPAHQSTLGANANAAQVSANRAPACVESRTHRRTRSGLLTALSEIGLHPSISATEEELRALEDNLGQLLAENNLLQDDLFNQGTGQQ